METKRFDVSQEEIEGGLKIIVKGHLNAINSDTLEYALDEAFNKGYKRIILNMVQVEFLSSSGIRVLLKTYKNMQKNGGIFNIEKPSQNVQNVLGITALDTLLLK